MPPMPVTPSRYYEGMTSRTEYDLLCGQPAVSLPKPTAHQSEQVPPTAPPGQQPPIVPVAIVFLSTSLGCQFANFTQIRDMGLPSIKDD